MRWPEALEEQPLSVFLSKITALMIASCTYLVDTRVIGREFR
jgi:hypothetical protein